MSGKNTDYMPHNKALGLKEEKDGSKKLKKEVMELKRSVQDQFDELKVYCE